MKEICFDRIICGELINDSDRQSDRQRILNDKVDKILLVETCGCYMMDYL